ncbi:MAG: serine/threonine-protein phosphatase [bacterium]|nr:serine/threonine-protein phosphatase [bacterium]
MKRRLNEDVFIVEETMGLFLVADGMGGHAAGEVASRLAAGEIIEVFRSRMNSEGDTWPEHWNVSTSATANLLVDAILSGHERVTSAVSQDANLKGMGTTVVAAVHPPMRGSLTICHVGDSRAYRLRGEELTLLTQDHSWVHEQVAAGFLTEEAARSHPLKNVVTQALGGSSQPRVDILDTEIEDGDLFLLCSDGLNSMLTDSEIAAAMMEDLPLDGLTQKLIILANERGGNDNITVVLLRPVPTECGEEPFE